MSITLNQEFDGQLSFIGDESDSLVVCDSYSILIDHISLGVKKLQYEISKKTISDISLKDICDKFIDQLIKYYNRVSLDEIVARYEDDASDWHKLNKILLFYLGNYIYPKGLVKTLDDDRANILESIIGFDQIRFKDEYYRSVLEEIHRRKKARVENYIIYDGNSFLNEVNDIIASKGEDLASYSIAPRIKDLIEKKNFLENLFISKVELDDQNQKGILAMMFLHYLRECVYNDPRNAKINKFIENIELFVILNYSPDFILSKRQKEAYEMARQNVSNRIVKYVDNNSEKIFKAIKDYDVIEDRKSNNKLLAIDQNESLDDYPETHTSDEIKCMLETFLSSVFLLKTGLPKENLPIFCDTAFDARKKSMKLALIYLGRYAYPYRSSIDDPIICLLEDFIHDDNDFHLNTTDMGEMFSTKSKLLSRVAMRRVKADAIDSAKRVLISH